ncbi:MAG: hemerythrin domain-containing protein [Desulfobacterales bacterium]|nr:hemerythrin domain-containing protein [Desulfobacterales bacterium]
MTSTQILKHEHEIILLVIGAAEKEAQQIENTSTVNVEKIHTIIDFIKNFADLCHHAKEEKILFPKLEEKGMEHESGPIAVMLKEHAEGRAIVKAMAAALPHISVKDNLLAYTQLLRAHINKENNVLFPMADKILTPEDQTFLAEAFERIEEEETGAGVHEKYHHLAHELVDG